MQQLSCQNFLKISICNILYIYIEFAALCFAFRVSVEAIPIFPSVSESTPSPPMIKLIRLALFVNFLLQLEVSSNALTCVWDGAEEAPCLLLGLGTG